MNRNPYRWAASGDVNAFFGLMLDNIAGLILALTLLKEVFDFPVDFAIRYMVPGTAIGVFLGDLMYFVLALVLARRSNRSDVTAMPLGLDTPSTIGMVLFVIGPAYADALAKTNDTYQAAMSAWHIGICGLVLTGCIKIILVFFSGWARRWIPRAGLLGSLAAIALAIIAFTQFTELMFNPIVGFASLAIVLMTLIGRNKLPGKIPGALGAVAVGCAIWYAMRGIDWGFGTSLLSEHPEVQPVIWFPQEWLTVFHFEWWQSMPASLAYLPYIIPFAITTVIGGIDCTESAASAGDAYATPTIIGVEAIATLLAGLCGGVIQTTPYIGHPAYKAMGGRAAYTLATALFVGGAGVIGYFGLLFIWIPKAAVLPILIFIGLEIASQSYHVTPRRHYAALAIACIPAFAKLVTIYVGQFTRFVSAEAMDERSMMVLLFLNVLAGGFIISSLLWSSMLAEIIDRQFTRAAWYVGIAAVLTLFGVIHSPLVGDKMFLIWEIDDPAQRRLVVELVVCYAVMGALLLAIGWWTRRENRPISTDDEFEALDARP